MLRRGLAGETAAIGKRRAGRLLLLIISIFYFMVLNMDFSYGDARAPYAFLTVSGIGAGNPGIPGGSSPTTPSAIDFEGNAVSSGYELLTWLDRNQASGGKVVLSSDISVYARGSQEYFYPQKKITIDTSGHSITVKKGTFLNINGDYSEGESNAEILGSGSKPLIILEDGGFLSLEHVKMRTAGAGSNAIYKKGGKMNLYGSSIEASGPGSAGIISKDSLELENVYISASGAHSTAVRSGGSIYVFFGKLCAYGDNSAAAVTSGAAITFDTSCSSPGTGGATVIDRSIPENNYYRDFQVQTVLNKQPEDIPQEPYLELLNVDDAGDSKGVRARAEWELSALDVTETGTYEITGKIIPLWDGIKIYGNSLKMKIHVKDPSVPDMSFITVTDSVNKYFQSEFPWAIDNTEDIILWRSDDNSEWYDYTGSCEFISPERMLVKNVEPEVPVYFKLEVGGNGDVKGISDVIRIIICNDNSYEYSILGGDRDGGDRDTGVGSRGYRNGRGQTFQVAAEPAFPLIYMLYAAFEEHVDAAVRYNAFAYSESSGTEYGEYNSTDGKEGAVMNSVGLSPGENTVSENGSDAGLVKYQSALPPEEKDGRQQGEPVISSFAGAAEDRVQPKAQTFSAAEGNESGYNRDYASMLVMTSLLFLAAFFLPAAVKGKWTR